MEPKSYEICQRRCNNHFFHNNWHYQPKVIPFSYNRYADSVLPPAIMGLQHQRDAYKDQERTKNRLTQQTTAGEPTKSNGTQSIFNKEHDEYIESE